jgi:hypothetical protein
VLFFAGDAAGAGVAGALVDGVLLDEVDGVALAGVLSDFGAADSVADDEPARESVR